MVVVGPRKALVIAVKGGPVALGSAMLYSSGTTGRPKGILRPLPDPLAPGMPWQVEQTPHSQPPEQAAPRVHRDIVLDIFVNEMGFHREALASNEVLAWRVKMELCHFILVIACC